MAEHVPDPVDRLASVVRGVEARLPDTTRSRGALALLDRLAWEARPLPANASRRSHEIRSRIRYLPWALGAACLVTAVAALTLMPRRLPHAPGVPAQGPARPGNANRDKAPLSTGEVAILHPFSSNVGVRSVESGRVQLDAGAGDERLALLDGRGTIALRGPGKLAVLHNDGSSIALEMAQGTLLVSFDHVDGRGLVVKTKDAWVRVTGTVFSVRSGDGPTLVSVLRGSVEVTTTGLPISVSQGRSWQVGAPALTPIDESSELALRDLADAAGKPAAATMTAENGKVVRVEALQPRRAPRQIAAATPEVPTTERVGEPVLPLDAESLYRSAEEALATGRVDRGKELLKQIVAGYPSDLLVGPAIYELGRIAFAAKDFAQARNEFERVRASRHSAVARFQEPAAFLICKSELELGHRSATNRCFEQYRADFPDSPHAADALALLASQTYRDQGCAQATPLFDEYLARFAGGSYAPEARVALNRCRH